MKSTTDMQITVPRSCSAATPIRNSEIIFGAELNQELSTKLNNTNHDRNAFEAINIKLITDDINKLFISVDKNCKRYQTLGSKTGKFTVIRRKSQFLFHCGSYFFGFD